MFRWTRLMATMSGLPGTPLAKASLSRLSILLVIWWILTDGTGAWWFGLPLATVATVTSVWLTPPARYRLRLTRIPGFALYFLQQSLLAGWDVARRIVAPRMPLNPEILRLPLILPSGAPTWWLMLTITLLPGTLSVRLHTDRVLEVHCLDADAGIAASVRRTERQLAELFGLPPAVPAPDKEDVHS